MHCLFFTRMRAHALYRAIAIICCVLVELTALMPVPSSAQVAGIMPPATAVITPGTTAVPLTLAGIQIYPTDPFKLDVLVDTGDQNVESADLESHISTIVKYFLASLTVPTEDLWVNLSPYEKDRIIPDAFSMTDMGRDLLAQDYILKQMTASLIYPEGTIGAAFWERVYRVAAEKYGTTDIPINTFNKVWIVPDRAVVYQEGSAAFVAEAHLKVMLEDDYLARKNAGTDIAPADPTTLDPKEVIRAVVIPELEKEVNKGAYFAPLRQIYHSLILALWFKKTLHESILGTQYAGQNKTNGIEIDDPLAKEKIYAQYIEAFKKGAYNYIKEEYDPATQDVIPRKYFSGGFEAGVATAKELEITMNPEAKKQIDGAMLSGRFKKASVNLKLAEGSMKIKKALLSGAFLATVLAPVIPPLADEYRIQAVGMYNDLVTDYVASFRKKHGDLGPESRLKMYVSSSWQIRKSNFVGAVPIIAYRDTGNNDFRMRIESALSILPDDFIVQLLNDQIKILELNRETSPEGLIGEGMFFDFSPEDFRVGGIDRVEDAKKLHAELNRYAKDPERYALVDDRLETIVRRINEQVREGVPYRMLLAKKQISFAEENSYDADFFFGLLKKVTDHAGVENWENLTEQDFSSALRSVEESMLKRSILIGYFPRFIPVLRITSARLNGKERLIRITADEHDTIEIAHRIVGVFLRIEHLASKDEFYKSDYYSILDKELTFLLLPAVWKVKGDVDLNSYFDFRFDQLMKELPLDFSKNSEEGILWITTTMRRIFVRHGLNFSDSEWAKWEKNLRKHSATKQFEPDFTPWVREKISGAVMSRRLTPNQVFGGFLWGQRKEVVEPPAVEEGKEIDIHPDIYGGRSLADILKVWYVTTMILGAAVGPYLYQRLVQRIVKGALPGVWGSVSENVNDLSEKVTGALKEGKAKEKEPQTEEERQESERKFDAFQKKLLPVTLSLAILMIGITGSTFFRNDFRDRFGDLGYSLARTPTYVSSQFQIWGTEEGNIPVVAYRNNASNDFVKRTAEALSVLPKDVYQAMRDAGVIILELSNKNARDGLIERGMAYDFTDWQFYQDRYQLLQAEMLYTELLKYVKDKDPYGLKDRELSTIVENLNRLFDDGVPYAVVANAVDPYEKLDSTSSSYIKKVMEAKGASSIEELTRDDFESVLRPIESQMLKRAILERFFPEMCPPAEAQVAQAMAFPQERFLRIAAEPGKNTDEIAGAIVQAFAEFQTYRTEEKKRDLDIIRQFDVRLTRLQALSAMSVSDEKMKTYFDANFNFMVLNLSRGLRSIKDEFVAPLIKESREVFARHGITFSNGEWNAWAQQLEAISRWEEPTAKHEPMVAQRIKQTMKKGLTLDQIFGGHLSKIKEKGDEPKQASPSMKSDAINVEGSGEDLGGINDQAMLGEKKEPVGGIDLDYRGLDLQTKGEAASFAVSAGVDGTAVPVIMGLTPVVFDIKPVLSLSAFIVGH